MKAYTLRTIALSVGLMTCVLYWAKQLHWPTWNNVDFPKPWMYCAPQNVLLEEYAELYDPSSLYRPSEREAGIPHPAAPFLPTIATHEAYTPSVAKNFERYLQIPSQDSYADIDVSRHVLASNLSALFGSFGQLPIEIFSQAQRLGCMRATHIQSTHPMTAALPWPDNNTSLPESALWEGIWEGFAYVDNFSNFKNIVQTTSTGVESVDQAIIAALELQFTLAPTGTYIIVVGP